MAFLYEESFRPTDGMAPILAQEIDQLRKNLTTTLHRISGAPVVIDEGSLYTKRPEVLNKLSGDFKREWKTVWDDVIIYYDPEEYGALSQNWYVKKEYYIIFGYFFSKPQDRLIIEKVLWHEFLHLVIKTPKPMHHGKIDSIIKNGLKLPGPPNPLGTVGWAC